MCPEAYLCLIDRLALLMGLCGNGNGVGGGGRPEPYTALYRNNERGGIGSEEKIS